MIPRFCRTPLLLLCGALLAASVASAAIYDYAVGDKLGRALRLNVPDDLPVIRGILIWGNGAGGDGRDRAEDPELVAFARSLDFCVLATGRWTNFGDPARKELWDFTHALQKLAEQSGRPELVNAPWLPIGHSNGGQMSFGLAALRPDRVIALVASKGGYYVTQRPGSLAVLHTPGLLVAGEVDSGNRRAAIHDLFAGNRSRGARWAWVEEEGTDHAEKDSAQLIRPFVAECVRLRLPPDADPRKGPITLREIPEETGWLVEPDSYKDGFARIASYANYAGNRKAAGWLPSERIAVLFRAFASYHKATAVTAIDGATGAIVDPGATVGYHLERPVGEWSTIELFEGATRLGRFTPADTSFAVHYTAATPGYLSFHGVVTYADGSRRTTLPRRVFVRAAPLASPSPESNAATVASH